jgi:hypothetical protein
MEKLEIKHLAVYLPYSLKIYYKFWKENEKLRYLSIIYDSEFFGINGYTSEFIKPILKPKSIITDEWLSELNCDLEHQIILKNFASGYCGYWSLPYIVIEILAKNHIDIFGLIEKGLAFNFNVVK